MMRLDISGPEDLYQLLMSLRKEGATPPYIFLFETGEKAIEFIEACSTEDLERFTQDDIHLVIEDGGQFYRFSGRRGNQSSFEAPAESIH